MSMPSATSRYAVSWVAGSGDRGPAVRSHEVSAATWALDPTIDCAVFKDANDVAIFSIRTSFLVAVELLTKD